MIALVIVLGSCVLGSCDVGEVPGGGADAGNTMQAQKFATVVKPVVMRCAIPGCHSTTPPGTGQEPNFYSYDTLAARYKTPPGSSSLIITHVADGGPHNNITYLSTAEKKTISDWIDGK